MTGYPLPGETIALTRRNVSFGTARPHDEPAPAELANLFYAWQQADAIEDQSWMAHEAHFTRHTYAGWVAACHRVHQAYCALADALKRHRDRCFTLPGFRFWWHVEPEGCRREYVQHERIDT